ncbi:MAG: hypothetical protein JSW44_01735, partial [Candidatus Bathyarchaeota archaeon]
MVAAVALIMIGTVAGLHFFNASLNGPADPSPSPTPSPPTPIPGVQLQINHLSASSNGTVSFDVSLCEYDSGVLEAVFINEVRYSWSEGSIENTTILKGQTKHWSKDLGSLNPGTEIQVTVQATPEWGSGTTTVDQPPAPDNNTFPDFLYD